jgi:hypothetical protein
MSHRRRTVLEKQRQREIEAEIGAEPDLLLFKNSVGKARFVNESDGSEYFVPFGLGEGSPDLVGMLRVGRLGVWFCLEVKADEGELDPEQIKCHAIWRRAGAIVETVRSAAEARAALERARRIAS